MSKSTAKKGRAATAPPTVTARGEGVVPGKPDEGVWTVEVTALKDSPDAALADIGTRSRALDDLLGALPVAKERRSTAGVTVREEFDWVEGKQVHRGFRAAKVVTVRLADATLAGRLIQESIARAAANVQGPMWWIAPDNPARAEACRGAAIEAKRKAEAYAQALGLRLGAVTEIREPSTRGGPMRAMRMPVAMSVAEAQPLDVDPGELSVSAEVEVTFHLVD